MTNDSVSAFMLDNNKHPHSLRPPTYVENFAFRYFDSSCANIKGGFVNKDGTASRSETGTEAITDNVEKLVPKNFEIMLSHSRY